MDRFKNWKPPLFDKDNYAHENIESGPEGKVHGILNYIGKLYGWRCDYYENLKLGDRVDIGAFTYLNAKFGIEIGDNCQIGSHCSIYSINTENNTQGKVIIGENSLIGSYTLILPGAVISPNSKIRARSIIK